MRKLYLTDEEWYVVNHAMGNFCNQQRGIVAKTNNAILKEGREREWKKHLEVRYKVERAEEVGKEEQDYSVT